MWTISDVFTDFLTILFLSYVWFFDHHWMVVKTVRDLKTGLYESIMPYLV